MRNTTKASAPEPGPPKDVALTVGCEASDESWRVFYRLGGAAALALVVIMLVQTAVFVMVPPPKDVPGWFALFQASWLQGLLAYELLMVVYVILSVPLIVAMYLALKPTSPALAATYAILSLVGIGAFVAGRPAFEMLALSQQHAAATNVAERGAVLAAGYAIHAAFNGMAFQVSYILGAISGLLVAVAMLKSRIFSHLSAWLRIASSVLDFGLFVPGIGLYLSLGSVSCLLLWNILVAGRLFQLANHTR